MAAAFSRGVTGEQSLWTNGWWSIVLQCHGIGRDIHFWLVGGRPLARSFALLARLQFCNTRRTRAVGLGRHRLLTAWAGIGRQIERLGAFGEHGRFRFDWGDVAHRDDNLSQRALGLRVAHCVEDILLIENIDDLVVGSRKNESNGVPDDATDDGAEHPRQRVERPDT